MQTIKPVGNLLSLAVKLFSSNVGYTEELKFWLLLNANQGFSLLLKGKLDSSLSR